MYTIKQAALRTGVNVPLLRAWERRYGVIRPARTTAGYRLYDEPAIERIRAMRDLVDAGWAPSEAARHLESRSEATDASGSAALARDDEAAARTAEQPASLARSFVDAAAALDERRVELLLDDLFAGGSFERVVDDRLMPVLRALGDGWAAGLVTVAAEHAASNAVLRRLAAAFAAAGEGDVDRPVLVGLPPGSRHEIGVLAFAAAVRRRGIGVVYLGADVPTDSWIDAVGRAHAGGVVIGVAIEPDQAPATEVITAVQRADTGVLVAVGGGAADAVAHETAALALPTRIGDAARVIADALRSRLA